ncbi:MAG: hypothetical protein ACI9YH_005185, partial [Colwellia sp.]
CVSVFWITNGCSLDTSRCLQLSTAIAVGIDFLADLLMLVITLSALTLCSHVSISIQNQFKSSRPSHRLVL